MPVLPSCRALKANLGIAGLVDIPKVPAGDLSPCTHFAYLTHSARCISAGKLSCRGDALLRLTHP